MSQSEGESLIPWDEVMAFGFGVLKLSSHEFWAMTPREIKSAMRAFGGGEQSSLSKKAFEELIQDFPDSQTTLGKNK